MMLVMVCIRIVITHLCRAIFVCSSELCGRWKKTFKASCPTCKKQHQYMLAIQTESPAAKTPQVRQTLPRERQAPPSLLQSG